MRTTYIVTYDVADAKRLRRVFKTCRNFGDHLQFSVFECDLTLAELANLEFELNEIINSREDQILIISLGPSERRGCRVIHSLGQSYAKFDAPCYIA